MQEAAESVLSPQVALAGAVLAATGTAFAAVPLAMLRHAFPTREVRPVRWGVLHIVLVALLHQSIGSLLMGQAGPDPGFTISLLATFAAQGIAVAAICYWVYKHDPAGWAGLGIRRSGNLRALAVGGLAGLMSFPMILGTSFFWPWLFARMGGSFQVQAFVEGFAAASSSELWLAIPLAVIVVPLFEEVIFRGFVQSLAVQRLGEVPGILVTSALFASLHGSSSFLPIFALAFVLGIVMARTGRLVAAWALHALFNGMQLAYLFTSQQLTLSP